MQEVWKARKTEDRKTIQQYTVVLRCTLINVKSAPSDLVLGHLTFLLGESKSTPRQSHVFKSTCEVKEKPQLV